MKKTDPFSVNHLAVQVGVSPSTVSRVLNGRDGVGQSTRHRVLSAARASGFAPTLSAVQLCVAIVIDRNLEVSQGGFVSSLVSQLVRVLSSRRVVIELVADGNVEHLRDRPLDGVLALTWDDATLDQLRDLSGVPTVVINRNDAEGFSSVVTDHYQQGAKAAEYFIERGHRRIAMICEERGNWGSQQRIEGFTKTLKKREINVGPEAILSTDHQPLYGVLRRMMATANPTAIFVAGEDIGLEAFFILREVLRLDVPRQMSLLGMESARVSQFVTTPLTTLCQPLDKLAREAVELLLRQMQSPGAKTENVILQSALIERDSVARIGK